MLSIAFAVLMLAAQTQTRAQLTITVTDATGGRIANTAVVLSRGTQEFGGTTNDEGVLVVPNMASGEWTLTIRKEGFLPHQQTLNVQDSALDVPVTLEVAGLNQTVQIETTVGPPNPIQLDTQATGGTLLDIPVRELPASLSIIPQELIQERGARSAMEAVQLTVGMVASIGVGSIPGYSTRGWGSGDISVMRDGIRQNTNAQSARPVDTFILDRVEVLKGPGSLLYGEGAIGGAVNYISKDTRPLFGGDSLLSFGSFGSYRSGVGLNVPITRNLAARIDSSYSSTKGYTDLSPIRLRAMSGTVRWTPTEAMSFKANGTYSDDNTASYYSTPFINGQIDPRTRKLNYNMRDKLTKSHNSWGQITGDINLAHGWVIHNQSFAATHRMDWRNFENYAYNAATQKVDIASYLLIWRDDILVGNRVNARKKMNIAGHILNFTVGQELQRNDLHRGGFSGGQTIRFSVDPYNPAPIYDPGVPYQRQRDVLINTRALFAESVFDVTKQLKLVSGLRWEQIALDYTPLPSRITASSKYYPTTGRVGAVYDLTSDANVYFSYSRAVQPTTQLVDLDGSRQVFSLVPGQQYEVGTKTSAFNRLLDSTLAYYAIEKRDLLITTLVNNVSTNQQVGKQTSNGIEFSVLGRPTSTFTLAGDIALTHAEFADFTEIVTGVNVSRDGNSPTNIPKVVWNITPSQRIGPVDVSATIRQVGARWGDTANTRRVGSYTTGDVQVGFRFMGNSRARVRVRNIMDKIYTQSVSATSGRLEPPRSVDVTVTKGF